MTKQKKEIRWDTPHPILSIKRRVKDIKRKGSVPQATYLQIFLPRTANAWIGSTHIPFLSIKRRVKYKTIDFHRTIAH